MKIFAISDIHIDFEINKKWLNKLSAFEFKEDVLIIAGDLTDNFIRRDSLQIIK